MILMNFINPLLDPKITWPHTDQRPPQREQLFGNPSPSSQIATPTVVARLNELN